MGPQRKEAEHVMLESYLERRTSRRKRLHTARAKTCGEDRTSPFGESDSVSVSQGGADKNQHKIDKKSIPN